MSVIFSEAPPSVPADLYNNLVVESNQLKEELDGMRKRLELLQIGTCPSISTTEFDFTYVLLECYKLPGERLCGETACLSHLPSIEHLYTHNREVTPLNDDGVQHILSALSTVDGVDGELFWQAFDQCNCNRYFTKGFLNGVHGPQCPIWPYDDTPAAPPPELPFNPSFENLS
jgi:hypothetical protein